MAGQEKIIFVYDDFSHADPLLMGRLYVNQIRGSESFSFEFSHDWLYQAGPSLRMDPQLSLYDGRQYAAGGNIFGLFADASPDRWGRTLMNKRERIQADQEGRKPRKLYDSDYLLGVYDGARMGGIRLKLDQDGDFMSNDMETATPPWTSLRALEEASRGFEQDEINEKWLRQLIRPGSSLGGARPKATVQDAEGNLWIAKFPSRNDENDTGAWEKVAHDLAKMCGLNVPDALLERFSGLGSTYLVKRFDRDGARRIHFASAMTLLGRTDGASAAEGDSYLDLVAFIRSNGSRPGEDLIELWKRIVFSMAITNTDDHLRNHAFILERDGWRLSPMFDVNPVPYGDELALNVDETDNRISTELAIRVAPRYGISEERAARMLQDILTVVRNNWEKTASRCGLTRTQIEKMRPAFSLCND